MADKTELEILLILNRPAHRAVVEYCKHHRTYASLS